MAFIKDFIHAIRNVVGPGQHHLHEPNFGGAEAEYLKDCLDTRMVSYIGPYVGKFEDAIAQEVGVEFCFATNTGTSALHLALIAAKIRPGDEVLIPAFCFVAPANAVKYIGATPHFVDVDRRTLGLNVEKIEEYLSGHSVIRDGGCYNIKTGNHISALVPMHTFGHPVDMDSVLSLAKKYSLRVIEDAAEGVGSTYKKMHVGCLGHLGTLSFNGNKIITTGGGGAVVTNNSDLFERVRHLGTTAKIPNRIDFFHDEIGYNYRMPNLNAAVGYAQLESLNAKVMAKRKLYKLYQDTFAGLNGVALFSEADSRRSNYWLQTVILDSELACRRDEIIHACNEVGIFVRPAWNLLNELPAFKDCPTMDVSIAKDLQKRIINLPSSPGLLENLTS